MQISPTRDAFLRVIFQLVKAAFIGDSATRVTRQCPTNTFRALSSGVDTELYWTILEMVPSSYRTEQIMRSSIAYRFRRLHDDCTCNADLVPGHQSDQWLYLLLWYPDLQVNGSCGLSLRLWSFAPRTLACSSNTLVSSFRSFSHSCRCRCSSLICALDAARYST